MVEVREKRVRTCVGCGKRADKVKLLRIMRTGEGAVAFDASGRGAGRGAYVCSLACFESALASRKLQRALKCGIDKVDAEGVAEAIASADASVGADDLR